MHALLFFETIIPLLEMMIVTCLIAISTPLNEFNFFSKLLTLHDDLGEPFFDVIHIGLVCEDCMKLESYNDQLKCTHKKDTLPPWKSAARNERFKGLFIATGNASLGLRENAGVVANDHKTVFARKQFEGLLNDPKPPHLIDLARLLIEIPLLWIMCDPDADGPGEMAIVSGFINTRYPNILAPGAHVVSISFHFYLLPNNCQPCCWKWSSETQNLISLRMRVFVSESKWKGSRLTMFAKSLLWE